MYATNVRSRRAHHRGHTSRPLSASRSGGIQGLVLVRDTAQAGGWMLKPTKPQAAAFELLEELEREVAARAETAEHAAAGTTED
ncbi:hypothetical protein KCV87_26115 [Actinosynnema pretiosum subsp. pretiosum]|uniref:Uncharacterized protein n=2 Tax=Actinosynnema TaxID=40566 RepID=C6WEZ6_ACTMD|nr:hypothetical protein [Actinosynnema mirum]ACU39771.1 hypothetical protein Amir_5963 [Actinosynnema mirum DSM 43827]AXX33281.1 hypothetical protein APASM_5916 [Actinosynnema pretiosum subsp. pretiosum]QUF02891.1 hypothetical protein KCV87_26115 [Actinosynnema pretiosum subsp. pretiosum]